MCRVHDWCVGAECGEEHGGAVEVVGAWGGREVRVFITATGGAAPSVTLEAGYVEGDRALATLDLGADEAREVAAALARAARTAR